MRPSRGVTVKASLRPTARAGMQEDRKDKEG
jgi:hypothetical protein